MNVKELHIQTPFELESGESLPEIRITYHTYGQLNAKKNNVIWVCHALTASSGIHDWWKGLYGKGKVFDPDKYFIISANNLGSPYGTISPKFRHPRTGERYGLSFPKFTLRDTALMHLELKKALGINDIHLLIGGSCGGNICLEMSMLLGKQIKNLTLLCCSAKEKPWTIAIHESQRIALHGDSDFFENKNGAGKIGLKSARAFALPFYRTAASMNIRQEEKDLNKKDSFRASSYIKYQGEKFVNRFDAHCYYKLLNALDTHNVGRGYNSVEEALQLIQAKTLVIGIDSDIFIPIEEQKYLAENILNAKYVEVKSIFGHDAFLIEFEQIGGFISNEFSL